MQAGLSQTGEADQNKKLRGMILFQNASLNCAILHWEEKFGVEKCSCMKVGRRQLTVAVPYALY